MLAVKNKGLPVFVQFELIVSALLYESFDTVLLVFNLSRVIINVIIVLINIAVICVDLPVIVLNAIFKVLYIVSKPNDLLSEGFKGNQNVGSLVDIVLIIGLHNDILTEVKIMYRCIEVLIVRSMFCLSLNFGGVSHSSECCKEFGEFLHVEI